MTDIEVANPVGVTPLGTVMSANVVNVHGVGHVVGPVYSSEISGSGCINQNVIFDITGAGYRTIICFVAWDILMVEDLTVLD